MVMVFDARPQVDYDAGHIPGSLSLPYDDIDMAFAQYAALLTPEALRVAGEKMGFGHVASGPLVRSSYHADLQARDL